MRNSVSICKQLADSLAVAVHSSPLGYQWTVIPRDAGKHDVYMEKVGKRGSYHKAFYCRYSSLAEANQAVKAFLEVISSNIATKAEYARERKAEAARWRKHWAENTQPGDIYVRIWGYEQTNVDFYEVIRVNGQKLVFRPISSKVVVNNYDRGQVVDAPGVYTGKEFSKLVGSDKYGYITYNSYSSMNPWDGQPCYFSTYA